MKPILYEKTETAFTSNGLGRVNCLRLDVKEDRNGLFELEMDVDIDDPLFSEITEERVVATIHDDTKEIQPFDIYARTEPISGVVTFYGRHIAYRLGKNVCTQFTAGTCVAAMSGINTHALKATGFTFWTDIASVKNFAIKQPTSIRSVLGGVEGSILDTFGGEYKWDKFTVKLYGDRGNDNGVTIRYGVNLTGFDRATDDGETYNAVAPFWQFEENLVTLTEGYVAVEGTLPEDLKIVPLDLSDQFDEAPTQAQLRARATSVLNGSANLKMKESIDIDFVALWQTSEYESVAPLQRLSLCDIATVVMRGRKYRAKIVSVTYDALAERYKSMTLGEARASFVGALRAEVEEVAERVNNTPTTSMMQAAIDYATELIRGGLGGHVVISTNADGEPEEILIMDTDDVATAVKIWRWNLGGLAYSSNGINGPYTTAITQNGAIVADFVTAGTMSANRIRGGLLALGGANNVDGILEVYNASGTRIGYWDKDGIHASAGDIILTGEDSAQLIAVKSNANHKTMSVLQTLGLYISSEILDTSATYDSTGMWVIHPNENVNLTPLGLTIDNEDGVVHIAPDAFSVPQSALDSGGVLTKTGTQTVTGQKNFPAGVAIYGDTPTLRFFRGKESDADFLLNNSRLLNIQASSKVVNNKRVLSRVQFVAYSHETSTGNQLTYYENYRLPVVTADRSSNVDYEILTSKNVVAVSQGGTGATSLDDAGIVTKSGAQIITGTKTVASSFGIYHNSGGPTFRFLRNSAGADTDKLAFIFTSVQSVNSKNVMQRLYFREYSYDTSGDQLTTYENYYLPTVTASRSENASYGILTTKSNVISRGAVTFSAKVNFAANETKTITLTGTFPSGFSAANLTGIVAQNTGNGNVVFVTISAPNTATSMGVTCRNFSTSALSNVTVSVTYDLMKQNY